MHWRRKWQPTPVFLPGESQGRGSLVGCVYGVAQSQARLKRLSSSSSSSSRKQYILVNRDFDKMLMLTNGRVKLQIFKGKPELFCLGELTKPTLKKWHLRHEITRWWNSSWAISNPKRWCCSSLNISTNLKNATVTSGLEKGSFHSNPKEGQCQRTFKLPHNCTHFTFWQGNAQNSSI